MSVPTCHGGGGCGNVPVPRRRWGHAHTHTASPTAAARQLNSHAGPRRRGSPPRLSRPSRRSRRASERVAAGRRQTPTCQHAQGPPVAPHGRGRVFRQGAAGRTSDFLNGWAMGKLAF